MSNAFTSNISHSMTYTEKGAVTNATTMDDLVNLFAIIGSSRKRDISAEFTSAFLKNPELTLRMLFWCRDIRGGAGERKTARSLMLWLEQNNPVVLDKVLHLIPEYGRWDDLLIFQTDYIKNNAYAIIKTALDARNGLCAKWMPRKGEIAVELTKYLGLTPKKYRKLLVGLTNVVETQMCNKDWTNINFSHVPSVASARYQKAFGRHAPKEYGEYLAALEKGDSSVKINASALFPHDVICSFSNGNAAVAEQQWQALPNFAGAKNVLSIVDVSGSMTSKVGSGSTTAMDIAIGLGLYMAEKTESAFKDVVLTFTDDSHLVKLTGNSAYAKYREIANLPWGGTTNLQSAFDNILAFAKKNNVTEADMPEYLMVISDMEFDSATGAYYGREKTNYQVLTEKYEQAGYKLPKVIFWNVMARNSQYPVTIKDNNTSLISGYSPAIMKVVLDGKLETFTPESVMLETLNAQRYDAVSNAYSV